MEEALVVPEKEEYVNNKTVTRKIYAEELKEVSRIAIPMIVVTVSQYLLRVSPMIMLGHLGELELSSASIATSLSNVTGFSVLFGMSSALETLCGQAYGAGQYRKLGIFTYGATICLFLVCIPVSLLWIFADKLLILIGQDPSIATKAGKYMIWLIPALFPYVILQSLVRYLLAQSLILPMLLSAVASLCFQVPICWAFIFKLHLGNVGAALSIGLSYWLNVIMLMLYVKYSSTCENTRASFSRNAFSSIGVFFWLAIPSAFMICLEWWSSELLILLSGLFPKPALETSVLSICFTTSTAHYLIPYSFGAAASTRVSNELGAGRPQAAKITIGTVLVLAAIEAILASVTLLAVRNVWGYAFTYEKEVIAYVAEITPILCITIIMDVTQAVLSGVARESGWQDIGAYVNLGAAMSIGLGYWLNVILLMLYVKYSSTCEKTRSSFSIDVFMTIGDFFRFAIPSAVMVCLEWWSFELIILLSGLLPNPSLETSVLSICFTTTSVHYHIPYSFGAAASTRVSNELGAGRARAAKIALVAVLLLAATEVILASITLFGVRKVWGNVFTYEKEVITYVAQVTPVLCISIIMDGTQAVLSGVARGSGWQHIGAYVNLGAYYLVGIPVALLLGFVLHLKGKGLWIGIVAGATVQSFSLSLITAFTNWEKQAIEARHRMFSKKFAAENQFIE